MTKTIPLAAVIGSPIAHSKSPKLHNYWINRYGLSGHYIPLHVEEEDFETSIRNIMKLGFSGANVTIPHKESVLDIADVVTDRAVIIGAANTLIFTENGQIHADNTDGYGFLTNLTENSNWSAKDGPVVLLGAGGASRAVVAALIGAGVTALGMQNHAPLNISLDALPQSAVVTDLVYAPLKTPLLAAAQERGCHTVDGLGMLLHQAAPGFQRWFGKKPDVDGATRNFILSE